MGVPGRPLSVRWAVLTYTQVFDLRIPSGFATPWVYTSSGFAYAFLLCNALGIHEFSICVYLADLGIRKSLVYVYLGLRQPAWTGYAAWPSRLLRPAIVSYTFAPPSTNSLSLPSRYHSMYASSSPANSSGEVRDQSLPL